MKHHLALFRKGFTFIELIIVIAILAVASTILLMVINPFKQMERSWDMQKKHDLAIMQKMFEDYYNDKEAYPQPEDVCLDKVQENAGICSCHICGLARNNFSAYLQKLHCDPQHPNFDYLYQFECGADNQNFRICAVLNDQKRQQPNRYHYGVASPNYASDVCENFSLSADEVTPTPNVVTPAPTLRQNNYYCSTTGCKPCFIEGNDCNLKPDKCEGEMRIFNNQQDCVTSQQDPVNGCHCQ